MKKKSGVPVYVFIVLIFSEILDAFGQYCFKRSALCSGTTNISNFREALAFVSASFHGGYLVVGIIAVSLVFLLWLTVLSKVDLSVAMPLTSCSYVFVALASVLFLHEHVSLLRWFGIFLILGGVYVVTRSAELDENTEKP